MVEKVNNQTSQTIWDHELVISISSLLQKLVHVNVYLTFLKASSNRLSSIVALLDTKKMLSIHLLDIVLTSCNLSHLTLITCQIKSYN